MNARSVFALAALVTLTHAVPVHAAPSGADTLVTTVILVRHADRDTILVGPDPPLSAAGFRRAQELKRVLGEVGIEVIYTTPFQRNRLTAAPLAAHLGLTDSVRVIQGADMKPVATRIRTQDRGKCVLVIGHSDTLPKLLQLLTGAPPDTIRHWEYDRLYVVSLPPKGGPGLVKLRYGEPTKP